MIWSILLANWRPIALAVAVLAVVGGGWAWIANKDRQIARAQAEARAAHVQTAHAVLYGVNRQAQVFADAASIAALRGALDDQSARVRGLETAGQQAAQEAAEGRRAAAASHAQDEARLAGLRRAVAAAGQDRCRRAEAAATAALEALR